MPQEQKPQEQQSPEQQERREQREQRKREQIERLSRPRKSEQEVLAERAELPKSERFKRRQERLARVREVTATERVRVNPRDDEIRRAFKNVPGRMGFPSQGSVEWPLDQYTKRRLRDGSITIADAGERQEQRAETQQQTTPKEPRATRNEPPTPPTS